MLNTIQKINALIVVSNLEFGGAQRQIIEFTKNIDTSKFNIYICSLSDYIPLADQLNTANSVYIIKKKFKYDITVIPRLVHLLNKLKIDIVHSYLFDADIAARIAGTIAHTPIIINSERNTNYHLKHRQLFAYKLTYKLVNAFIANSHVGATFNQKKLGYASSMYSVIHNGVDTNHFKPVNADKLKLELGLTQNNKVIGMFASFKEQKNHPLFFRTAKKILLNIPESRFLLVGDILYGGMHGSSEYANRINRLIDHLELRDHCLFLGNRSDVRDLYNICDITILPSLFEGTPNVLLESMACGTPVVATDVADNSLIVQNHKTGYLAPLENEELLFRHARQLLTNDKLRSQMSQSARNWMVEKFSTERMARKTETIYLKLLKAPKKYPTTFKPHNNPNDLRKYPSRKDKIKVVIATHFPHNLGAPRGGVESVSVNLVLALKEYQDLELHVVTFTNGVKIPTKVKTHNFTVHQLPTNRRSELLNNLFINKRLFSNYLINEITPDLVHVHDTYGILASNLDIPKVLTIHGFIHKDTAMAETCCPTIRALLWKFTEVTSWKKYQHIISITPYVQHTVEKIYQPHFFDIPNPVSPKFFNKRRNEQKIIIFCAAEISPRKNTLNLIKACNILVDKGYTFELRLAGPGMGTKYGFQIQDFITSHKIRKYVVFLGQISAQKILEELCKTSIFALISLEENSPMGIEEAMAMGIPIVTSNCCGMPFMIENGKSGFLVNPYDINDIVVALQKIINDDILKHSMGIHAKAIASARYDSSRIAQQTHDAYYNILYSQ